MEVLNVKVERETREKIERLVKARGYKNKSEAIRALIQEHFEEHPELFADEEINEILTEASLISDASFDLLAGKIFMGRKSAAQLVGEGRERSDA
ncbi:MAG TPA: ribbon-helix-helix domain-containing protein [Terriglobales bacterium]|nr:ribbon-helix-helix domain-containing protein [Terriglobales bacterium]